VVVTQQENLAVLSRKKNLKCSEKTRHDQTRMQPQVLSSFKLIHQHDDKSLNFTAVIPP
jgi:hypothetical protein